MALHHLLAELERKLFEAENRRINALLIQLNQKNKALHEHPSDGFLYQGEFYRPTGVSLVLAQRGQRLALHTSLIEEMKAYLTERQELDQDQVQIRQSLSALLIPCKTDRQIRNALPECLVECLPGLGNHPRTEEAGYTVRDNPRAYSQFEKLLPKMQIYSVGRLLY